MIRNVRGEVDFVAAATSRFRAMVVAASMLVGACSSGKDATPTPPVVETPVVKQLLLTVKDTLLTALGDSSTSTLEARDQFGANIAVSAVQWSSSDARIADVSTNGVIVAAGNGSARITARVASVSASADVRISQRAASLTVTPSNDSVSLVSTETLQGTVRDRRGNPIVGSKIAWTSANQGVARVDTLGHVSPVALGSATITATSDTVRGTSQVRVVAPPSPGGANHMRAVFMGGNWGDNNIGWSQQPADYYKFLDNLHADWIAVSVALHVDNSLDAIVKRKYAGVQIPTFSDDALRAMFRGFRTHGLHIYFTLAFEAVEAETAAKPVVRWQFGDPKVPPGVQAADWPWTPTHPMFALFVSQFWASYTEQAVHFATIAQEEGVELFSVGTETDRLFRTQVSPNFGTQFRTQLQSLVAAVRSVYHGKVTYDQSFDVYTTSSFYGTNLQSIWSDLGFDVIGVSAYFPLAAARPTSVMTIAQLETSWDAIFETYLVPLQARNPTLPIVFTEFGYVDHVESPFEPNVAAWTPQTLVDRNGNGLDDGEETQANIFQAFFNSLMRHPVVQGAFFWDNFFTDDARMRTVWNPLRNMQIRQRLSEEKVRQFYGAWK